MEISAIARVGFRAGEKALAPGAPVVIMVVDAHSRSMDSTDLYRRFDGRGPSGAAPDPHRPDRQSTDSRPASSPSLSGICELLCHLSCREAARGLNHTPYRAIRVRGDGWPAHPSPGMGNSAAADQRLCNAGRGGYGE